MIIITIANRAAHTVDFLCLRDTKEFTHNGHSEREASAFVNQLCGFSIPLKSTDSRAEGVDSVYHFHINSRAKLPTCLFDSDDETPPELPSRVEHGHSSRAKTRAILKQYGIYSYESLKILVSDQQQALLSKYYEASLPPVKTAASFGMLGRSSNWHGPLPPSQPRGYNFVMKRRNVASKKYSRAVIDLGELEIIFPGLCNKENKTLSDIRFLVEKVNRQLLFVPSTDTIRTIRTIRLEKITAITKDYLVQVKRNKEKKYNRRACSQNSLFDYTSANTAAEISGLQRAYEDADNIKQVIKYEWTHLIAHEFIGDRAQEKENLVLATAACNTTMMHLEHTVRKLVNEGQTVELKVGVEIAGNNASYAKYHVTREISYEVKINGEKFNFKFDTLSVIVPPKDLYKSYYNCIKTQLESNEQAVQNTL